MLFLCTGNICRSAYGHRALRARLIDAGRGDVPVASAGVQVNPRLRVPPPLVSLAEGAGIRGLSAHAPEQVGAVAMAEAGLVLTATQEHMRLALREVPRAISRTFTILEFAALVERMDERTDGEWIEPGAGIVALARAASRHRSLARATGETIDIADPYGGPVEGYAEMVEALDAALAPITSAIVRATQGGSTPTGALRSVSVEG